jgi:hypothetical protein
VHELDASDPEASSFDDVSLDASTATKMLSSRKEASRMTVAPSAMALRVASTAAWRRR